MATAATDRIARRYDHLARFYGPIQVAFGLPPGIRDAAVRALALEPGDSVLEVGCGTGRNLERLVAAVGPRGRVEGVDLSPEMLARAERLRADRGWANVSLRLADAERAEWPQRFEAVLFSLSYSVLPRPQATLSRVWERLEPGGRIVIMDAVLPEGPVGRLLRLPATALSHATVLGDPDTRPWDDLEALGIEPDTSRFLAGTYFVCSGRKPG